MSKKFHPLFIIVLTALGCALCSGMASGPEEKDSLAKKELKMQLEQALLMFEDRYEAKDTQGIGELLDKDYKEYSSFISLLDTYFQDTKSIKLRIVMDSFLTDKDMVHVRLHWLKNIMDSSGSLVKTEGLSEFVFKITDEGLKLSNIRKDNPFF
jgi:hypothetical protein